MIGLKVAQASRDLFLRWRYVPAFVVIVPLAFWAVRGGIHLGSTAPAAEESQLVSIQARDADVRDVLRSFADQLGARLALDPAVHGKLSIQAEKSDLTEVMNDLCTVYSCQWSLTPDRVLTVSAISQADTRPRP